jgi:hypothetical protein
MTSRRTVICWPEIACAAFLGFMTCADAATLTVCKHGCEYTLINSAVAAAASGDTISIGKGTFQENVVITAKNLSIKGYSQDYTVIDGGFHGAVLTVNGTAPAQSKVALNKLTLMHGSESGISANETTLNLQKVILISNVSGPSGGGNGGGITATHSVVKISSSLIAHNRAPSGLGGGIYAGTAQFGGSVFTIVSSDIFDNTASEGGGLYIDAHSAATLNASTVTSNAAANGAGASVGAFRHFSAELIGFITLNSSIMANNSASEFGGALYVPWLLQSLAGSWEQGRHSGRCDLFRGVWVGEPLEHGFFRQSTR